MNKENGWPHIVTKADYARFEEAFKRGAKGLDWLSSGYSSKCGECEDNPEGEASFSWHNCDICNRSLGGDRYPAHAIIKDKNPEFRGEFMIHLNVCSDCLYYMNYRQLDDEIMFEIADNSK